MEARKHEVKPFDAEETEITRARVQAGGVCLAGVQALRKLDRASARVQGAKVGEQLRAGIA